MTSPHTIVPPKPKYFYRSAGQNGLEIVRPVLASVNRVDVRKPHTYPKHQHLNYQLILALRGLYRCRLNDALLTLKPGDVLIVKRGDWHEDYCALGLRYLAVNFDLAGSGLGPAGDILFARDVEPRQQVIRGPNRDIRQVLDRMQVEPKRHDHLVAQVENALLLELFWALVRGLPRKHLSPIFLQQSATQAFSDRLRRVFESQVTASLSAPALAQQLGVSVRTLTKRCHEAVGRPPGRAFAQYKMEYAARVLRQSNLSIKEISHRLGFQNQYHFSRVFRRCLGVPPSAHRGVPK